MDIFENFILLNILVYLFSKNCSTSDSSGDYSVELKFTGPCDGAKSGKNLIQYNLKINRNIKGKKIFTGNVTYLIPFSDELSANFILDKFNPTTGAYMKNYFHIHLDHVCMDTIRYMGRGWTNFQNAIKMPNKCPFPQGTYVVKGFDINSFYDHTYSAVPATFFYGRYKLYIIFKKSSDTVGCHYSLVEVNPIWDNHSKNL